MARDALTSFAADSAMPVGAYALVARRRLARHPVNIWNPP
jgi:hypothetical protein